MWLIQHNQVDMYNVGFNPPESTWVTHERWRVKWDAEKQCSLLNGWP
jgi:hypothetical protein